MFLFLPFLSPFAVLKLSFVITMTIEIKKGCLPGTWVAATSYPSGFIEGKRWMRVSWMSCVMRWLPWRYSSHRKSASWSNSSRPSTSFPCMFATYLNSGSTEKGRNLLTLEQNRQIQHNGVLMHKHWGQAGGGSRIDSQMAFCDDENLAVAFCVVERSSLWSYVLLQTTCSLSHAKQEVLLSFSQILKHRTMDRNLCFKKMGRSSALYENGMYPGGKSFTVIVN